MPLRNSRESNGPYWTWGYTNKRYYYKPRNKRSRDKARARAELQARAILWRQNRKRQ